MADALTIEFAITGADKIAAAFASFARGADSTSAKMNALTSALTVATDAYRALTAEAEKYNRMQGSGPAIHIGRGGQAQRALAQGEGHADGLGLAQSRNERAIQAAAGPAGLGGKLAEALKTSRPAALGSKSLVPLAGRVAGMAAEALGPELLAVAGPVGLVVAAAVEASKALFELTKASAEAGASYAKFTYAIGNNGPGAAKALSVGRMAGLDASGTAALAESLNSAITGSAMGRVYGMHVGAMNQAGPWGSVDRADNLTKAIEGLRKITDFSDRVRTMNALNLQPAAAAILMPQAQYNLHQQDTGATSKIMDSDFQQKSLAFQDSLERVGDAFDRLMVVIGKPAIESMTNVLNNIANGLNNFAVFLNSPLMQAAIKTLEGSTIAGALTFATRADDPHMQALQENTAALHQVAQGIPGVYGKDTDGRLGRAFPAGLGYGGDAKGAALSGFAHRRAEEMRLMQEGYAMGAF